jgi:hypothetical protein
MKFQLSLSLGPSGHIIFEGEEFKEIAEWWEAAGGKVEWLSTRLHDVVTAAEEGPAAATVVLGLGGYVETRAADADPTTAAARGARKESRATPYARTAGAAGKNGRQTEEVDLPPTEPDDDPWADEGGDVDPWDEPERPTKPAPERHGSAPGGNRAKRDAGKGVLKDNFGRIWTLNLPEAPDCDCGEPAGKMVGTSQSSGKRYTVWRCAKDAPGGNFRDKCEFSEFPERT